jgi:hypothetical protein
MAGKPGVRNAYWYEDPVTYISLAGGGAISKVITKIIKDLIAAEAADCATDGQCLATQYVDEVIQFSQKAVRHAYDRHYADWGISGHRTPAAEELFKQLIVDHINGPNTQQILGSYRGTDAIHFFDPTTNLNVITNLNGGFIGAWKLSPVQVMNLFATGNIQ